jgi:hypothetical protein
MGMDIPSEKYSVLLPEEVRIIEFHYCKDMKDTEPIKKESEVRRDGKKE